MPVCHQGVELDLSIGWDRELRHKDGAKEKGEEVGEVPSRMEADLARMITG